jgi:hypothetical protein
MQCTPSTIKPRIRSTIERVGRVDDISGLSIVSSTIISKSEEYEVSASNTMGGIIRIPIPEESITTDIT